MENIMKLHQLEETLKSKVLTVFENWGYRDGLSMIKECLLAEDDLANSNFEIVTTTEPYDGEGTIFNRAIDGAASIYFLRKGEPDKAEKFKIEEYVELMDTVEFIKTRIH